MKIEWTDHPKCSLGTIGDEWYFITMGTASSYAAQLTGDYSSAWHAMSSEHSVSMLDYLSREEAKAACEGTLGTK